MSSNATPRAASARIRRATSTVSRPSPGAEKHTRSSAASPGTAASENRYVRTRFSEAAVASVDAACTSSRAPSGRSDSVRSSPAATVSSASGASAASAATSRPSAADAIRTSSNSTGRPASVPGARACTSRAASSKQGRAIDDARVGELGLVRLGEPGEVWSGIRQARKRRGRTSRLANLAECAGHRTREPGAVGDRREIGERTGAMELEDGAGSDRFRAKGRTDRQVARRQCGASRARRELGEREPMPAEARAATDRQGAAEVVGRLARRADDDQFGARPLAGHERFGRGEALRSRARDQDTQVHASATLPHCRRPMDHAPPPSPQRDAPDDPRTTPPSPPERPFDWWRSLPDEALLDLRMCDLGLTIEASALARRIADLHAELDARQHRVPPALLALRRVVHAGRRRRHRDPVLSRPPAPRGARGERRCSKSRAATTSGA